MHLTVEGLIHIGLYSRQALLDFRRHAVRAPRFGCAALLRVEVQYGPGTGRVSRHTAVQGSSDYHWYDCAPAGAHPAQITWQSILIYEFTIVIPK